MATEGTRQDLATKLLGHTVASRDKVLQRVEAFHLKSGADQVSIRQCLQGGAFDLRLTAHSVLSRSIFLIDFGNVYVPVRHGQTSSEPLPCSLRRDRGHNA
jgi:hypothetical protein